VSEPRPTRLYRWVVCLSLVTIAVCEVVQTIYMDEERMVWVTGFSHDATVNIGKVESSVVVETDSPLHVTPGAFPMPVEIQR
jgi:hypothetical protein